MHLSQPAGSVADLMATEGLTMVFQPVAVLTDGRIYGHEALVRTPADCAWANPDALFAAARAEGVEIALELQCVRLALTGWAASRSSGRLFLNLSASALVTALAQHDIESMFSDERHGAVAGTSIVIELTEHEHVRDVGALGQAVARLRSHGARLALDDFGDGRSSLRLWSELKPEIVKIDKYFTRDLAKQPDKVQTMRALLQISQTLGSQMVAEGVETVDELRLLRDLGIHFGQGWVLGRPAAQPVSDILPAAAEVIISSEVAVFPERRRPSQQRASAMALLEDVPPVSPTLSNDALLERFNDNDSLRAVAIVDLQSRPLGLITRQRFIDRYAKPFFKELHGRKACTSYADLTPRLVDVHHGMDELTSILTSEDQRYLSEGFIIVENGRYRGLGSGERLVRLVTEARIEAARHANPLSLLPGNIPLTQHIQRLLDGTRVFAACYCDLNQFKPFNDEYGYWRGDEMILLLARTLAQEAVVTRDFVGHVGGDDFVVLFQSADWLDRCERIIARFNAAARSLYDDEALAAGGLQAEDRHGVRRFHPLTTLSIGVVLVDTQRFDSAESVANAAAAAKRKAKQSAVGLHVLHREPKATPATRATAD